jgi:hypothetical protein
LRIVEAEIEHAGGDRDFVYPGEPITVRLRYEAQRPVDDVSVGIAIYDRLDGRHLFGINSELLGIELPQLNGGGRIAFEVPAVPLLDGTYPVALEFCTRDYGYIYDHVEEAGTIQVVNGDRRVGTVAFDVGIKVTSDLPTATVRAGE